MSNSKPCEKCGAPMIFLRTRRKDGTEGWTCVDAETVADKGATYFDPEAGHVSHFATCPYAKEFRRKKAKE